MRGRHLRVGCSVFSWLYSLAGPANAPPVLGKGELIEPCSTFEQISVRCYQVDRPTIDVSVSRPIGLGEDFNIMGSSAVIIIEDTAALPQECTHQGDIILEIVNGGPVTLQANESALSILSSRAHEMGANYVVVDSDDVRQSKAFICE